MKVLSTSLDSVILLLPDVHEDSRGYYIEKYSKRDMNSAGVYSDFVQDNGSYTKQKGTLRGIHFQNAPMFQVKLIRVTQGALLDVVVDLRKGSPTYLKWLTVELNAENKYMLYLPRGYGHGFLTE